jgi:hypothetical protein
VSGGNRAGSGGSRNASGYGGGRHTSAQRNAAAIRHEQRRRPTRTSGDRTTNIGSNNNVNIEGRDVNIDVEGGWGGRRLLLQRRSLSVGGRHHHRRDGHQQSRSRPVLLLRLAASGCGPVVQNGASYYQCGSAYYQEAMHGDDGGVRVGDAVRPRRRGSALALGAPLLPPRRPPGLAAKRRPASRIIRRCTPSRRNSAPAKQTFVEEQLALTPEQLAKFRPIYAEHQAALKRFNQRRLDNVVAYSRAYNAQQPERRAGARARARGAGDRARGNLRARADLRQGAHGDRAGRRRRTTCRSNRSCARWCASGRPNRCRCSGRSRASRLRAPACARA